MAAVGCGTRRVATALIPIYPSQPPAARRPGEISQLAPQQGPPVAGALSTPESSSDVLWSEPFDQLDSARWREVEIHRRTQYQAVTIDGRRCLKAESHAAASILVSPVRFNTKEYPWLSWEWGVDKLVEKEALKSKGGSDAAARVYVYFETRGLPWQKRSLDYVWSASLPVGTMFNSPWARQSKIIVVESGTALLGQWKFVERNINEDYRALFGEEAPSVVAVAVMTDTDNTGGEAVAYFDNLQISRSPKLNADTSSRWQPNAKSSR